MKGKEEEEEGEGGGRTTTRKKKKKRKLATAAVCVVCNAQPCRVSMRACTTAAVFINIAVIIDAVVTVT